MTERPTILVVDDDALIRRPLEFILRKEGFDAMCAADGGECLERIAERRPDLIILDVMMPGRDGFELCREIRRDAQYAEIPIILLSARAQDEDRHRGMLSGASDFMTKPYSPAVLLRRVRELVGPEGAKSNDIEDA